MASHNIFLLMANLNKKSNLPKRRLASLKGCKMDLYDEMVKMFEAFNEALKNYHKELLLTPPQSRVRGYEASVLNSKMIQSIQERFPNKWMFGKYKRFILRINGYLVLFKKLNNSDMPMNIKTKMVSAINGQLSFALFNDEHFVEEPILYFGYRKTKYGEIIDPKLVYIDEHQVKWTITERDLIQEDFGTVVPLAPTGSGPVSPSVRESAKKKKKSNS